MPLQTDRLVMISLGILNDVPPVDIQPPLPNGIHLRWTFQREVGFPWYGYYLFRRPHEKRPITCVSARLTSVSPETISATTWSIPEGTFRSDTALAVTQNTGQTGVRGLDLSDREYVQFDLPVNSSAFRVLTSVGFRETLQEEQCVDLPLGQLNQLGSRFVIDGVIFKIRDGQGPSPTTPVTLTVTLPEPVNQVSLDLTATAGATVMLEALDNRNQVFERLNISPPATRPRTFRFQARQAFRHFQIWSPQGRAILHRLCYLPLSSSGQGVTVTAFDNEIPVASTILSYAPGQVAQADLWFDRITSVRISSGDGALIELCYNLVSADADKGWRPVSRCPQPIALPLAHPQYPAHRGSVDLNTAWNDAQTRIVYGSSNDWAGEPFRSLHTQLEALVVGGPPGPPDRAMSHAARAYTDLTGTETSVVTGDQPPRIPQVHPLDLVMLGSIHPAIAQIIGLYWADPTTDATGAYDYLIVADHEGVGNGNVDKMLSHIQQVGFSKIDAWITFNQRMATTSPLKSPQGVRAYALPGGTYRRGADGKMYDAQGNIGLTWQIGRTERGYLQPGHPVMYHVWRDRQGNGTTPVTNAEARELVTEGRPLLLINPSEIADRAVQYPADWPPFTLRCIDFALAEGWYGYQVNAIDLFGRFSARSSFAEWRQWNPPPQTKPWYYKDPPASPIVHSASVRILDKLAPPSPLAVEAYALDPNDSLLVRDQAYRNWLATLLTTDQNILVGLRVRWWWTAKQQQQAPDTTEFRVYWHGGTQLPGWDPGDEPETAKWRDVMRWDLRCYVCSIGQHIVKDLLQDDVVELEQNGRKVQTVIHRQGDRCYEVFLPIRNESGPFANGLPLSPTLIDPTAYANVTVTAADAAVHSPDRWLGTGPLAGRTGNESQPAAPQRVYQVRRQRPDPPPALVEPSRYYATPADYHSRSYFNYQWQPAADLWVHVYRALDDSVFKMDWANRSQRGSIDLTRTEHQVYFPPDWNAARQQAAAAALNALNSEVDYRSLSDDALRVLAGLPGNEKAFSQLTTAPLDSSVSSLRDALDGRAINRYFYRAAYVDKAQNRSEFSLASAPIFLPNVTPPKAPVITKVVGGDREITLTWASNRETDLAEYRVYRAHSAEAARDVRLMEQVHTEIVTQGDSASRPASVQWIDKPLPGLKDFWYCVVAVDWVDPVDSLLGSGGNVSSLSSARHARAFDLTPPEPPTLTSVEWVRVDSTNTVHAWTAPIPAGTEWLPAIHLKWTVVEVGTRLLVQVKGASEEGFVAASGWLVPGTNSFLHRNTNTFETHEYRLKVVNAAGNANSVYHSFTLSPP